MQASAVKEKLSQVDYSKEITKDEAVVIAQNHILSHKIRVYSLWPSVQESNSIYFRNKLVDVWRVLFTQRRADYLFLPVTYEIDISIKNGDIVGSSDWV